MAGLTRMKNNRPEVGVGVIVRRGKLVLLGRRKNAHGSGTWSFPGGHLEFNESVADCASREVFEETGLRVKNIRNGPFTNDIFEAEGKHYVTLFVVSDYDSGDLMVREPEKCEEWGWFDWSKLPQPIFIPIQNLLKTNFDPFS